MKSKVIHNLDFSRKVNVIYFNTKVEVIPLIIHYLINDYVLFGDNPLLTFSTKKEADKYIKQFLSN